VTGRPAVKAPELNLKHLAQMYGFRNRQDVMSFIRERPHLLPILLQARHRIEKHFGKGVPVVLEVSVDPEADREDSELFACIQTPLSVDEAHERMEHLDKDWALSAFVELAGDFCVDMEFV